MTISSTRGDYAVLAESVQGALTRAGLHVDEERSAERGPAAVAGGVTIQPGAYGVVVTWEVHGDLAAAAARAEAARLPDDPDRVLARQVRTGMHGALRYILRSSGYAVIQDPGSGDGKDVLIVTGHASPDLL
jgi:hypothetical protein